MNENKPKRETVGESKVIHLSRGFAIPMIVIFMTLLVIFGILWFGVLATDLVIDVAVNPIIQHFDPEAEAIDIMSVMSPPTSEEQAAKVYATFPTLDTEGIKNAFAEAIDKAPDEYGDMNDLTAWVFGDLRGAFDKIITIISDTIETYPSKLESWYNDHLPFRSLIFNANERAENYIELGYSEFQNKWAKQLINAADAFNVLIGEATVGSPSLSGPGGGDPDDFDDLLGDETESSEETDESESEEETLPPLDETEESETVPEYTETEGDGSDEECEHEIGESEVLQQPTCSEWGVVGYRCQRCEKIVKREYTAKAAHRKDEGRVEKAPTCSEVGIMAYNCLDCGAPAGREYIDKLPHSYEAASLNGGEILCGMSYVNKCTVCGSTENKRMVKSHTAGTVVKTVDASYTTYGYTLVKCSECNCEYRKDLKNKLRNNEFQLPIYRSDTVMEGRYQWLFYRGNGSQAYFEGTNIMTEAQLSEYVTVMNTLNNLCKEKGITLQICIWPDKDQVYPEYVTWSPVTNEKRVDRLVEYVEANSDVKIIYPLKELKAAKPYFDTYLKYDTHWNSAGGFVGYQAMMKSLGLETMDAKNAPVYEYTGGNAFASDHYYTQVWGDMIGLGGLSTSNLDADHNYYVKYRPHVTIDTKTGGNGASDTRHTTAKNATYDCNFVMLGDSYRVMQLGYLEKDFSDCFLTHRSRVNNEDVKEAIKSSDILVLAAVERLEPDILNTAKAIIKILSEE